MDNNNIGEHGEVWNISRENCLVLISSLLYEPKSLTKLIYT